MKLSSGKVPLGPIPRSDSLLHRLQHAPGQGSDSFLDQLMIFLDDPPPGIRDRWKEGAAMCTAWGIPCTGASVWRLYRSHAIVWRSQLAFEASVEGAPNSGILEEKAARMIAWRICEILANPQSPPASLVSLARIEVRKRALELDRKKHDDNQRSKIERALDALEEEAHPNWEASFALGELKKALKKKPGPHPLSLLPPKTNLPE